jgi:3-methyladenine DNA glycosylase/8-oxoguanine DNA glycosylase/tetratricopeptide (TPR) repeat protein
MKCPHCSSIDTTWKSKAAKWECNACEERFAGEPPADEPESVRPLLPAKAAKPKRIFFSYGHDANRELVDRFKADLEARGHQVWIDYKEIGAWDNWKGEITRGIHESEMAIAFLSIHSTRDPGVCRNEVAMALQHFGKVYPVLVEQVPLESIPVTVAHLQWPDLSRWREFRDQEDLDFERFYEEKFLEIVSRVEGEAGRFASEAEVLRRVLNPSGFEGRFARHLAGFTGREWVFEAYEHWLDHQPSSRVFWVKAGPGFGKTALAVQMANRHRAAIVGTWFCDHQSVELRDPLRALQTIAYQLALRWDDYRVRLLPRLGLFADSAPERIEEARQELAKKSLHDLFSFLISEPMAGLIWREHKLVILVDALDEGAEADGTNPLAALISGRFLELPEWIGFVVTSRPDASVVPYLQGFKPFSIQAGDERNTADLQAYCQAQVSPMLPTEDQERICAMLVEKSAGMMLYLRLVSEGLREGILEASGLEKLESGLPGLYSRYHAAFEARFRKDFQEKVQPLLRLVMAAPGPLPLDLAREVLGWDRETAVCARAIVGSYLVEDQGGLSLFHKTLGEWLGSEKSGIYFTDSEPAAMRLGEFLWGCFDMRVENAFGRTDPFCWELFVGDWLPKLIPHTKRCEDWSGISSLGLWFREKLQTDKAEELCLKALNGREKSLGNENPDTLTSLNDLANLLTDKRDYEKAEALYRRALEVRERVLGLEHPDTLVTVNNIGNLLDRFRSKEAETFHRRAWEGRERVLGGEHPDTLKSMNNLSISLNRTDLAASEILCRRALEIKEKTIGENHPSTLKSVISLGNLLCKKRDSEIAKAKDTLVDDESIAQDLEIEAESLYRRAIVGFKKALGSEHPDTLLSLSNLAKLLNEKRDYEGAEVLYRETLEVRLKVFGKDHPDSLTNLNKLAELLVAKGEKGEAEALYHQVLEGFENKWGADHPYTFSIIKNLGQLLADEGSYEKMGDYYRRIFLAHKEKFRRVQDYWRSSGKDSHFHPDSPVKASSRQNSYKECTQATLGGYIDLDYTLTSGQVFHWNRLDDGSWRGLIDDEVAIVSEKDGQLVLHQGSSDRIAHYFSLDQPLDEIYKTFPDFILCQVSLEACQGLRILRQPHWECIATFITSSMKYAPHIRTMSLAIRERFGKPVMDSEINAYPSFEDLAKAPEEALRKCGLGYRAENLLKTARLLADGKLDLETIGRLPTSEISRILQTLPGISERIANCILLYSYDRLDVVPIDLHTNRLLYYMRNGSPDELTVYAGLSSGLAGRQFGPYAGYVGRYTEEFARRLPREGEFLPSPPSIIRE